MITKYGVFEDSKLTKNVTVTKLKLLAQKERFAFLIAKRSFKYMWLEKSVPGCKNREIC